jgi:hypothetical protein
MRLDGRMFYFKGAATTRQLSELLLENTRYERDKTNGEM